GLAARWRVARYRHGPIAIAGGIIRYGAIAAIRAEKSRRVRWRHAPSSHGHVAIVGGTTTPPTFTAIPWEEGGHTNCVTFARLKDARSHTRRLGCAQCTMKNACVNGGARE